MNTINLEIELSKFLFTDSTQGVCKRFQGSGYSEMDVAKLTNTDYIYEYELKISRSDFLKDVKNFTERINRRKFWKYSMMNEAFLSEKKQYKRKINDIANKFYFVCPENLIKESELLDYQGLIYVDNDFNFKIIKDAKFLHKNKIDMKTLKRFLKTLSERDVYDGYSKITYDYKKKLIKI